MATKKTKTSSRASAAQPKKKTAARSSGAAATTKKKTSSKAKAAAAARTTKKTSSAKKTAAAEKSAKTKTAASKPAKKTSTAKKVTKKTSAAVASTESTTRKKKSTAERAAKGAAAGKEVKTKEKKSTATAAKEPAVGKKKTKTSKKTAAAVEAKDGDSAKKKTKKSTKSGGAAANTKGYSVAEVASKAQADAQGYVFINGRRVRMISTKGAPVKKTVKSAAKGEGDDDTPAKPKNLKTHLSKKELNHYRALLIEKRHEIVGDLGAMEQEALRNLDGGTHMPIHMADVGTDTYDQDFMLGLAEAERKQLAEIDDALMRIQKNTYGVCVMTGKPIPDARLEAKPWAKYTIEAARQLEGNFGP